MAKTELGVRVVLIKEAWALLASECC